MCVCCKVAELEAHGGQGPSDLLKDELTQSLEELEALLKAKDEVGHLVFHFILSWSQRQKAAMVITAIDEGFSSNSTVTFILFQEIHILQSKKAEYHDMEHDRDEAIHRLRVGVCLLCQNGIF